MMLTSLRRDLKPWDLHINSCCKLWMFGFCNLHTFALGSHQLLASPGFLFAQWTRRSKDVWLPLVQFLTLIVNFQWTLSKDSRRAFYPLLVGSCTILIMMNHWMLKAIIIFSIILISLQPPSRWLYMQAITYAPYTLLAPCVGLVVCK